MLSRLLPRVLNLNSLKHLTKLSSTTTITSEIPKNISSVKPRSIYRLFDFYEDVIGLKEVKQAQKNVNDAEINFINAQNIRRSHMKELHEIQEKLKTLRLNMEKLPRSDDRYLQLFTEEHDGVKIEKRLLDKLLSAEQNERQLFSIMQLSLRDNQEKERLRTERTKYWSVIGSVIGALCGIIGATITNYYRLNELKNMTLQTENLFKDVLDKQNKYIDSFRHDMIDYVLYGKSTPMLVTLNNKSEEMLISSKQKQNLINEDNINLNKMFENTENTLESKMRQYSLITATLTYAGMVLTIPIIYVLFKNF
ncbi:unnamed protein product [Didymodactylos carnosus]|uniref:Coiled-coil domain-containing protein 51 n=1 Tax=Didymodactylos carnosus TaxID=1234261 RepID=A0A814T3F7_9BILA|nr:unnamed protein product [Didymodactylos carnosus]CAF1155440.1 unnamed protein product [Didymodactylos carnosus]CAF3738589.1 unnamed protein product [Didymodactylos carnosus]CAF3918944.1 unnamed protein product [Didymodactylos carnosus]